MSRVAIFPLLGPAFLLYLVADVASSPGVGGAAQWLVIAVAFALSVTVTFRAPRELGARLLGWLGLGLGFALLGFVGESPRGPSAELAVALGHVTVGTVAWVLALRVPDALLTSRARRLLRAAGYLAAAAAVALSLVANGPPIAPFGAPLLLPVAYAYAPEAFAASAVAAALALRSARRRMGSSPEALAANTWGVLALAPAAALGPLVLLRDALSVRAPAAVLPIMAAVCAVWLYVGHAFLVDPRRRVIAGRSARDVTAAGATIATLSALVALLRDDIPRQLLPLALWVAATLVLALMVFRGLRVATHRAFAPFGGRLLHGLRVLAAELPASRTRNDLARVVLTRLRELSGAESARPVLYGLDPQVEATIDAAGEPHLRARPIHPAILEELRRQPGEIIVTAPLAAQIVRKPRLRPLVDALREHDVLCVLPLVVDGELEGALLVPAGLRRTALTLEELCALAEHARALSALLAVFSAQARAEERERAGVAEQIALRARLAQVDGEAARLREQVQWLHGRGEQLALPQLIAYSAPMRALLDRLRSLAASDAPLLLQTEAGLDATPLAAFLHSQAERSGDPLLCLPCSRLRADQIRAALFGGLIAGARTAGALELAGGGTVLLADLPAIPLPVQQELAAALASRAVRSEAAEPYALRARVVATTEVPLERCVERGLFDAALAAHFAPATVRVAPLRERAEDLGSHVLVAIDEACRRLGRAPLGIEPEALAALRGQPLPGNVAELSRWIALAVARATGTRITKADLALEAAGAAGAARAPAGTLEEIERAALVHALVRAGGNKSEAARLLGVPRTTFLDKLRRHRLDDGERRSSPPN